MLSLSSVAAAAQPRPEPLPLLDGSGPQLPPGPDGNLVGSGVLLKPYCFKALDFCATPGMKLMVQTQRGRLVALHSVESPRPFTLLGVRFAANEKVELARGSFLVVGGVLEAPVEVEGRLVKGRVELEYGERTLRRAQTGTLAREAVIEGWKVPADYSFDLRNLASGSMVLTGAPGLAPATWEGEAVSGLPTKAVRIAQGRDGQGATRLELELATPEPIEGLDFGTGPITFLRWGEERAVQGVVKADFERGAVKAPKGSLVVLCNGALQSVKNDDEMVGVGSFVTSKVEAVRERTAAGAREEPWPQNVTGPCREGALLGYRFLPQYCPSCGAPARAASLADVDLKGEPRGDQSRAMLSGFPSRRKANCPPCR